MSQKAQSSSKKLFKGCGIKTGTEATVVASGLQIERGAREGRFEEYVGHLQLFEQQDGVINDFFGSDLYSPIFTSA